jgi:hypothetical protein
MLDASVNRHTDARRRVASEGGEQWMRPPGLGLDRAAATTAAEF